MQKPNTLERLLLQMVTQGNYATDWLKVKNTSVLTGKPLNEVVLLQMLMTLVTK